METASEFYQQKLHNLAKSYVEKYDESISDIIRTSQIEMIDFLKKHCNGRAGEIITRTQFKLNKQEFCLNYSKSLIPEKLSNGYLQVMQIAHPNTTLLDKLIDYTLFCSRIETMQSEMNHGHMQSFETAEDYFMYCLQIHLGEDNGLNRKGIREYNFEKLPRKLAIKENKKLVEYEFFKFRNNIFEQEDVNDYFKTRVFEQLSLDVSELLKRDLENFSRKLHHQLQ